MPKVSIVIPVYNVEQYIRDCIESVLSQTYKDYEIILVDDGSPDCCPQICDEYANRYSNIYVIHKSNGGRSSARNIGVEKATGEFILFVDSDDTIEKNLLEVVVPKAEETKADVTIFGIHTEVSIDGVVVEKTEHSYEYALYPDRECVENHFVTMSQKSQWNHPVDKLYRRNIITDNGVISDPKYDGVCEDTMFLLDLFPFINSICIVEGAFYNYYIRKSQSVVTTFIPERYKKLYGRFCKTEEIVNSLHGNYSDFLCDLYVSFVIWAYEFMFHQDCKFDIIERKEYIKDTFSICERDSDFSQSVVNKIETCSVYRAASKTTKLATVAIIKRQYTKAWLIHILSLVKNKSKSKE